MNGYGKDNQEEIPLQDNEEEAFRGEIERSKSLRRSFGQSFISSGKKASFFSSMANIYSTAVGAGALSLPILVCKFGFIIGVFLIFAVCFIALVSGKLLQRARVLCGKSDMSTLAYHCFKSKGTLAIRLILIFFCLGMTVSYIIVMCTIINKIISAAYPHPKTTFFSKKYIWAVMCVILVSPFVFAKSMERLRFVSYINSAASFVYLIISIIGAARTIKNNKTHQLFYGPPDNFKFQEALTAFGCIFVAYAYHFNFFPVYKSLSNPSDGRMMNTVFVGVGVVSVLYAITACTGYITFGGIIDGDVLSDYETDTTGIAGYYILLISYLLLTICGMPMQFFGGRNPLLYTIRELLDLIQKKRNTNQNENNEQLMDNPEEPQKPTDIPKISMKFHIICTAIIYSILCVIGITVTNLEVVISILGCVCGNSISYILPGMYVWYLERISKPYKIVAICVVIFGIVSLVLSLAGIIWNEVG